MKLPPLFIATFFLIVTFCLPALSVFASTTDGTISGYAWGNTIGWVNFGCTNCNAHIIDTSLSGYAWSQNFGWINLSPTNSGVTNNSEGTLSAKAWGEQTGWINFSGVTVSSAGVFSGTASIDNGGSMSFGCTNCNVTTDWRPASTRPSGSSSGGSVSGGTPITYAPQPIPAPPDTTPPTITITQIKNSYAANELIIIGGTGDPGAFVSVAIDNGYASFFIDPFENWLVNFGVLSAGNHHVSLTPTDLAGNIGKSVGADFTVQMPPAPVTGQQPVTPQNNGFTLAPPLAPIFRGLAEGIQSLLPRLFAPLAKKEPKPLVIIPKQAPPAFRGRFHYLSTRNLSQFVLAPLPTDIALLAQKIPQLGKTFNDIGVNKITDVEKLKNANLKLPSLTETTVPHTGLAVGQFTALKGVPLANLSATAKAKIPTSILFAKAGSGLVDYNVALSVNDQGKAVQTIKTVVGQYLQLIVKTAAPAKKVTGYIIFKSKQYSQPAVNVSASVMTASLLFGNPDLAAVAIPDNKIAVEGVKLKNPAAAPVADKGIEQRLVLSQFEYVNTGENIYTATVRAPAVDGQYEVVTVAEYQDPQIKSQEIKLVTVVDPEGYVYEKSGGQETRIAGSVVSLYWLNPDTKKYELWPAKDFQQENPQVTDQRGTYSFLVPEGYYYIKVDAPGYSSYEGSPFQVTEGSGVHINIELKSKNWWLKVVDWKTLLLAVVILLLLYNFYNDRRARRREKVLNNG